MRHSGGEVLEARLLQACMQAHLQKRTRPMTAPGHADQALPPHG